MSIVAAGTIELNADAKATAQVLRTAEQWDRIEGEWNELFDSSPTASAPLRFDWLRQWWRIYGPVYGGDGLRIIEIRSSGRLIGALPLYASRRPGAPSINRLAFISTGEREFEETCPDYLDLLHLPGREDECLAALTSALMDRALAWDELVLSDVGEHSPLLALAHEGRLPGASSRTTGECPIADISGGLDAYFVRLSANTRQQSRRLLRQAGKEGVEFELAFDEPTTERLFEEMIRLHQQRWTAAGCPGVFAAPRFTEFHGSLARRWVPRGHATLCRLSLRGQTLAVLYGFRVRDKFDFYQSGVAVDERSPIRSPGIVAFLRLMEHLAGDGVTIFDFLRGSSSYKQRLATGRQSLFQVRAERARLRLAAYRTTMLAARVARKGFRYCTACARKVQK